MSYSDEQIAQVCHEANRALQQVQRSAGTKPSPCRSAGTCCPRPTKPAPRPVSAPLSVAPTPVQLHEVWREALEAEGWVFGPAKDGTLKTHPNLVAYASCQQVSGSRITCSAPSSPR